MGIVSLFYRHVAPVGQVIKVSWYTLAFERGGGMFLRHAYLQPKSLFKSQNQPAHYLVVT